MLKLYGNICRTVKLLKAEVRSQGGNNNCVSLTIEGAGTNEYLYLSKVQALKLAAELQCAAEEVRT